MATYLEQELEDIKSKIYEMADLAMESISRSIDALKNSDVDEASKIIDDDTALDLLEVAIDDDCIKFLVTRQPAAVHLRLVLSLLKINTDLERIGDLSTNVARETIRLEGRPLLKPLVDIPRMASIAIEMIRDSFKAITEQDVCLAREIIERDREIDELNLQVFRELFTYMAEDAHHLTQSLSLIMIAKALERIGDHATNIAERAIFYIEGVDVRHCDD